MSSQTRHEDDPLCKSNDRQGLYDDTNNSSSLENNSALFSFFPTAPFELSARDAVAMSVATIYEPTPFRDGTYLESLKEESSAVFVPRQSTSASSTKTIPPFAQIDCRQQSDYNPLQDDQLSDYLEEEDDSPYAAAPTTRTSAPKISTYNRHQDNRWVEHYQALLRYKSKHGNCHVPQNYQEDPGLARWARRQRHQYKLKRQNLKSSMSTERQVMLEQAGFVADPQMDSWEIRRQDLEEYKRKYGDCNVPARYTENPALATWVKRQRRAYKRFQSGKPGSRLCKERFVILSRMEFVWKRRNENTTTAKKSAFSTSRNTTTF
ncbi:unnamed protein product [Cylindrotheca closterium]|uniref:Helicase-associated domain-containing protein n=1 Tax=Cylindrotheca closterium TaxID=2856 RepID=A0AAD2CNX1_9STRA|nr:unnamed protein product [Cylindrotheca closterium]